MPATISSFGRAACPSYGRVEIMDGSASANIFQQRSFPFPGKLPVFSALLRAWNAGGAALCHQQQTIIAGLPKIRIGLQSPLYRFLACSCTPSSYARKETYPLEVQQSCLLLLTCDQAQLYHRSYVFLCRRSQVNCYDLLPPLYWFSMLGVFSSSWATKG